MKHTEILKKRVMKDYDRDSNSEKSYQVGVIEEADENPCDVLTAEPGKENYSDAWLLDSRCTHHMYLIRELFSTYKPYDGGFVLMGNNIVCKTVGICIICMRMFDGHVRTLTNVRHVSDLKKNLLSLGALKAQRCKFSSTDGCIKVTKGFMTILKGERSTNLYKMIGSAIVGDASTTIEKDTQDFSICILDT